MRFGRLERDLALQIMMPMKCYILSAMPMMYIGTIPKSGEC